MRSEEEKIIEIRLEQSSCVLRVKQASQLMKNRRFGKARGPELRPEHERARVVDRLEPRRPWCKRTAHVSHIMVHYLGAD